MLTLENIIGCYNKFKTKVFYDTNIIMYREKIALFEKDGYLPKLEELYNSVISNYSDINHYINPFFKKISFYPIIKEIDANQSVRFNYVIDVPIELQVIDVLWTVMMSKEIYTNDYDDSNIYGNLIDKDNLFFTDEDGNLEINWENNSLFKKYVHGYNIWLKNAQKIISKHQYINEGVTLATSDFTRFYYSVSNSFKILNREIRSNNDLLIQLTDVVEDIHEYYRKILKEKTGLTIQNGSLPLGLSSSMLLSNIYLHKFDLLMNKNDDIIYYGRYVDDIIMIFKKKIIDEEDIAKLINKKLRETLGEHHLVAHPQKTKLYNFSASSFTSEFDKFVLFFQSRKVSEYGNEDEEDKSYRRYIDFGKKLLNSSLMEKGTIDEYKLLEIKLSDAVLFMNYIFTYVKFSTKTIDMLLKRIQDDISVSFRHNMWKEYYKWINLFVENKDETILKMYDTLQTKIREFSEYNYNNELRNNQILYVKEKLIQTYLKINLLSLMNSDSAVLSTFKLHDLMQKSGMTTIKTPIRFLIENIYQNKKMDNSTAFYKKIYKNKISFIALWEVLLFDQIINILFNKKKSIDQSIKTFMIINNKTKFDYISTSTKSQIKGFKVSQYKIDDEKEYNSFIVSHPNLCLDDSEGEPLESWQNSPKFNISTRFLNNIIEADKNKTNLLVFPELYIYFQWLHFLGYTAQLLKMNITMGMKNIIINKRYHNLVVSMYHFRDNKLRRNLFVTCREKNFYAYEEKQWCENKYKIEEPKKPIYNSVLQRGITFADYMCYEVTDIFSRGLFKGYVDMIVIPMLNKDTSYFNAIIYSLSRDLSCIVVTSNSASWGNSSIVLPRKTSSRILTEFKGGFNQYLVSTDVPIYKLIEFNDEFITKNKKDSFKPQSANFTYKKKRNI